jgi:hypothetical protein
VSKRSKLINNGLAVLMLAAAVLACSSTHPSIDRILDANSKKEAGAALVDHGPLEAGEVQYVYDATKASSEKRRRNAARLLLTTVKGNALELQHKALLETGDVFVWQIMMDDLLEKELDLAGRRPEMIRAALAEKDPDVLGTGLRAGALSNYPGIHELARKYLDHPDGKVRAAAVSGLLPADIIELLPRLTDMITKEKDEDAFTLLAKSLIRTNDAHATEVVIKAIENLKQTNDTLWIHFFNNLALFTMPDPITDRFLFALARSKSTVRDEGYSVLGRQVWANHRAPYPELVKLCAEEIERGTLSTDPRRQPRASEEQDDCEILLSFMNNGKDPIEDFAGRIRGADAVAFAKKWLKDNEDGQKRTEPSPR